MKRNELTKKEKKRLTHLFGAVCPPMALYGDVRGYAQFESMCTLWNSEHAKKDPYLRLGKELIDIITRHGMQYDDYRDEWRAAWTARYTRSRIYGRMPRPERKDNKDYINTGTGGHNVKTIRYPKKNRKTAWKRFYRLFPKLNPENKQEIQK